MGSLHVLATQAVVRAMHAHGFRVVWALRQRIDAQQSNEALQRAHFVMAPFVPQLRC